MLDALEGHADELRVVGTGNSSAKAESLSLAGVIPQNLMVRVVIIAAAQFV